MTSAPPSSLARKALLGALLALALLLFLWLSWPYASLAQDIQPAMLPGVTVELQDNPFQDRTPGEQFLLDFTVTNDQAVDDTFVVSVHSDEGWPVEIVRTSPPTHTTSLEIDLPVGLTAQLQVSMTVPAEPTADEDEVTITVVSLSNPLIQDVDTFIVNIRTYLYLPIARHWYPPIPFAPVLNAIDNADQDGLYTVSWQPANLAATYSLEEDDNSAFSSPTVVYSGSATSWDVPSPGKVAGTYYYRVRGHNDVGYGPYSQTQSAIVSAGKFYADAGSVVAGSCTTLRWNFTNVKAVYVSFAYGFDKRGVTGVGSSPICPSITTTYEALVINQDNSQTTFHFTVNVTGSACGDPYVIRFEPTTYTVNPGEKFSIFWDVECAKAIYYSVNNGAEQGVPGHGSKIDVQIYQDSLFKLRIEFNRGGSDNTSFSVDVR